MRLNLKRNLSIIACGLVILSSSSLVNTRPVKTEKSMDQYWAESGLDATELEMLLAGSSCFSERTAFLACVNSIQRMGERYSLKMNESFQIVALTAAEMESFTTEKE